jgi:hypothetical protein
MPKHPLHHLDVGAGRDGQRARHLPVGGRRYRPTLEDMVEFLITERLARPKRGWKRAIADGREEFRKKQLRAAIRRDPDTARDALEKLEAESD